MEGKPQFHSCLILKECTFASLKVCNLSFVFRGIVLGVSEFRIETPGIYTIDGNSLGFGPTKLGASNATHGPRSGRTLSVRSLDLSSLLRVGRSGCLSPPGLQGCFPPSMPGLWSSLHSSVPMAGICSVWKTKGARSRSNLEPEIIQNSKVKASRFSSRLPQHLGRPPGAACSLSEGHLCDGPGEGPCDSTHCSLGCAWRITASAAAATACLCKYCFYYSMLYPLLPLPIVWPLSPYRAELTCCNRDRRIHKAEIKLSTIWLFPTDSVYEPGLIKLDSVFWYPEDGTSVPLT